MTLLRRAQQFGSATKHLQFSLAQEALTKVNMSTMPGLVLLVVASAVNASFTLPMKYARRWAWENTWLVWSLFALLALPLIVTLATVPHLWVVYGSVPFDVLLEVIFFGAGWGIAQIFFGLAIDAIGIALTFSLVMGTSAAVGSLVPLVRLHPERLNTAAGYGILAGNLLVIAGVAVCALAGKRRDKALNIADAVSRRTSLGLVLAVLCGLGASFVNFGVSFGTPLIDAARRAGATEFNSSNSVWLPLMLAGAVPNFLYCIWLLRKNRTSNKFGTGGFNHYLLAFVMAIFWFGSTVLYGVSVTHLGSWGPILGWPLFMSLIVITASLLGIFTGEWKNSGTSPIRIQLAGVFLLVLAAFSLAILSRFVV